MALGCLGSIAFADSLFVAGDLVVSVEGCGAAGGTCASVPNGTGTGAGNSSAGGYGDNQAAPLTLFQYAPTSGTAGLATYVNSLALPQTASGGNFAAVRASTDLRRRPRFSSPAMANISRSWVTA